MQTQRNAKAARPFFGKLTAQFGPPRVAITPSRGIAYAMHCRTTDKLRSYIKPIRQLSPDTDHRAHKGLNKAIEVSQRPTRKREKIFGRFKSIRHAQRFISTHDPLNQIFRPRRYQLTSIFYPHARNASILTPEMTPSTYGAITPQKWQHEVNRSLNRALSQIT